MGKPTYKDGRAAYMRGFVERKKAEGKCPACNGEHDQLPATQCSRCAKRQSDRLKERIALRKTNGHCTKCAAKTVFGRGLCFDHWCASTAQNTLKKWDRGPELKALWEAQGGRCALTGLPLDADAQIDHIHPRFLGGDHTVNNLRWVAPWVNVMKNGATDDEFRQRIRHLIAWAV